MNSSFNLLARKRVIGLIRVSTSQQAEDDRGGIPRQRTVVTKTVEAHNLECIEVVELAGVSGTAVRENPEIQRILGLIQSRSIQGVVVADLDRLLRPAQFEDLALFDVFCVANAFVYCGSETYDFGSPEGKFMATVRSAFSGLERHLILKRMGDSMRELCKAGKHPFGLRQLPRGITYERKTGVWSITPEIVPVQEAFRLIDEEGVHNVAEVARRTGMNERALHNLIRNPLYMGVRRYETGRSNVKVRSKAGRLYKPKIPLAADKVIEVTVLADPPVCPKRFSRVQDLLRQTTKNWKDERSDRPAYNLVRSVARCAQCSSRLYFSQDRRRPKTGGYYFCSKHYYKNNESKRCSCGAPNQRKVEVDLATISFMNTFLSKPSLVRAFLESRLETTQSTFAEPEANAASVDFEQRRKRLIDGYEVGLYGVDEMKQRLSRLRDQEMGYAVSSQNRAKALERGISEKIIACIVRGANAFKRISDPNWQMKAITGLFSELHYSEGQITAFKIRSSFFNASVCEDLQQSGSDSSPRPA